MSVLDYARYAELFGFHGFRGSYPSDIVPAPKSALLGLPDSKAADFEDLDLRPVGWLQDYGGAVVGRKKSDLALPLIMLRQPKLPSGRGDAGWRDARREEIHTDRTRFVAGLGHHRRDNARACLETN